MNILETTELKKYYGKEPNITKALDGVNLSVEKGEVNKIAARWPAKAMAQFFFTL